MNDTQRWDDVFGCIDMEHWYFYSDLWNLSVIGTDYQDFDLMFVGGGPL